MFRSTADTLRRDDLGPSFALSDPTRMGAFARCAPARGPGATPPTAGPSTDAVSATPADVGGPPPVGVAGTGLEQLANRTGHCQTGDRPRLAPPRLPPVLDVEEPPPDRSADRALRCARADSDDVAGQPALGRSPDPRRVAETGHRRLSGDRREIHGPPSAPVIPDVAHVLGESPRAGDCRGFLRRCRPRRAACCSCW